MFFKPSFYISIARSYLMWIFDWIRAAQLESSASGVRVAFGTRVRSMNGLTISKGVQLGKDCELQLPPDGSATLRLDPGVRLGRRVQIAVSATDSIHVGRGTSFHNDCLLTGKISVGQNCLFAPNVFVANSAHRFRDVPALYIREQDRLKVGSDSRVVIEDDCWLGWGVVAVEGAHISKGCVIGANSFVNTKLEPYGIYAGAPAKLVGKRLEFSPPAAISADDENHKPYFYSGFESCFPKDRSYFQFLPANECEKAVIHLKQSGAKQLTLEFASSNGEAVEAFCGSVSLGEQKVGPENKLRFPLPSSQESETLILSLKVSDRKFLGLKSAKLS